MYIQRCFYNLLKENFWRGDDHEVQPLLAYKEYQICETVKKKIKKKEFSASYLK